MNKSRTVRRTRAAYFGTLRTLGLAEGAYTRSVRMVAVNPTVARVGALNRNAAALVLASYSADLAQYRYENAKGRVANGG